MGSTPSDTLQQSYFNTQVKKMKVPPTYYSQFDNEDTFKNRTKQTSNAIEEALNKLRRDKLLNTGEIQGWAKEGKVKEKGKGQGKGIGRRRDAREEANGERSIGSKKGKNSILREVELRRYNKYSIENSSQGIKLSITPTLISKKGDNIQQANNKQQPKYAQALQKIQQIGLHKQQSSNPQPKVCLNPQKNAQRSQKISRIGKIGERYLKGDRYNVKSEKKIGLLKYQTEKNDRMPHKKGYKIQFDAQEWNRGKNKTIHYNQSEIN